jgi:RimJ/RimL family protein N-acetyltransferase
MIPDALSTERLYLRCWSEEDATRLVSVLEANAAHLHWIPAHVAAPVPLDELEQRLSGFAADFRAGRCWRFGIFSLDQRDVFGEISLFPRSDAGRVQSALADRVEIGYWLRHDVTGRGYATEATLAMVRLVSGMPGMRQVEIRCDPLNEPSAAVPKRLGFRLASPASTQASESPSASGGMLWVHELI